MKLYDLINPVAIAASFTFYGGGGGGGKGGSAPAPAPTPVPPPPPPVVEDADVKAEDDARRNALRRGRASTVLTQGQNAAAGSGAAPTTAVKTLLGS